jgi:acetyltransferase-like isoleucine patch superfamily enzyme
MPNLCFEAVESVGKHLSQRSFRLSAAIRIVVGDDVRLSGKIGMSSGHILDARIIGNDVFIGGGVAVEANRQIVIEDNVLVSQILYCRQRRSPNRYGANRPAFRAVGPARANL